MTPYALATLLIPAGIAAGLPPFMRLATGGLPGLAFLGGWATALIVLWLAGMAGVPLHFVAWGLAGVSSAALAQACWRQRRHPSALLHPLAVVSIVVIVLLLTAGPVLYRVYAWDSWTNWVGWSQQMVVSDAIFRPDMWISTRGYTPGWPLAMALPDLIGGHFATEDAWAASMSLHIGLLALIFDVARLGVRRFLELGPIRTSLAAWAFLLSVMALELSWSAIPTLLLVEEPQYYFLSAGFLAIGVGLIEKRADPALLLAATLTMVAAYLFKSSFLPYAPSYLLMAGYLVFAENGRWAFDRRAAGRFAAIVLAIAAPILLWKLAGPHGRCQADVGAMVSRLMANEPVYGIPFDRFAGLVLNRMTQFALGWKLPVTLAAVAGFALFVRQRFFLPALLALIGLWLLYYTGIVSGMAACFTPTEIEKLASVQRYTRVPLRLFQTLGVVMLMVAALHAFGRLETFGRLRSWLGTGRSALVGLSLAVSVLGAWQIDRGLHSIRAVEQRSDIRADFKQRVEAARNDVRLLAERPSAMGRSAVRVLYFAPPPTTESVVANFYGLGDRRGGPLRHIDAESRLPGSSPDPVETVRSLAKFDAIGIVGQPGPGLLAVPAVAAALRGCRAGDAGYLLLRAATETGWHCVPRQWETRR